MNIIKHIPNTITCLNLFSGCIAVVFAFSARFDVALLFMILAAVFDFMDGLAARALQAYSAIGKELDSLADMVSFGLLPGVIVYVYLSGHLLNPYLPFVAFLIPVFSALRLAKFNLDERQTTSFIGMPTPANALFWGGLMYAYASFLQPYIYGIIVLAVLMSLFLVAEFPLFSLIFKNLSWQDNKLRFVFLAGCIVLLALFLEKALCWLIVWYVFLSVVDRLFHITKPSTEK